MNDHSRETPGHTHPPTVTRSTRLGQLTTFGSVSTGYTSTPTHNDTHTPTAATHPVPSRSAVVDLKLPSFKSFWSGDAGLDDSCLSPDWAPPCSPALTPGQCRMADVYKGRRRRISSKPNVLGRGGSVNSSHSGLCGPHGGSEGAGPVVSGWSW